jgi:hypothetical protein
MTSIADNTGTPASGGTESPRDLNNGNRRSGGTEPLGDKGGGDKPGTGKPEQGKTGGGAGTKYPLALNRRATSRKSLATKAMRNPSNL